MSDPYNDLVEENLKVKRGDSKPDYKGSETGKSWMLKKNETKTMLSKRADEGLDPIQGEHI